MEVFQCADLMISEHTASKTLGLLKVGCFLVLWCVGFLCLFVFFKVIETFWFCKLMTPLESMRRCVHDFSLPVLHTLCIKTGQQSWRYSCLAKLGLMVLGLNESTRF